MITRPGGYCPMCDTVYDRPHECVGKAAQAEMRAIWNEAIETAALIEAKVHGESAAIRIRKLKK